MPIAKIQTRPLNRADRMWHLRHSSLVSELSEEEIAAVAKICSDQIYPKGRHIFREGDPARRVYILNRGYVQLSVGQTAPRRRVLGILKGGQVFGEETLGLRALYQATATAYEECWAVLLPKEKLLDLVRHSPGLSLNVIRILTRKLSEARTDLQDRGLDARQRVAKTLLKLGESHGRPILAESSLRKLGIAISHRRLAGLIGGNRAHISTILSDFKKLGMVDYQGRKLLLNIDGLSRCLDSDCHAQAPSEPPPWRASGRL